MKEFQYIKDMKYEYNADDGLAYASPVRGVWNIVHIGTLVPGGHQIYVCPTSCLRGVVLTTAEMGRMDKLSTITVGEDNIIEGNMEEQLLHGTERIIEELPERPKMIMVFISCIHHFLAVNYQRIYKILREEYPDIDFIDAYMDPIMRRTAPVVPVLWRQMTRPFKRPESWKKDQVNYLGNCFTYGAEYCDLTAFLNKNGIKTLEANNVSSYEEYISMQESEVNFVFHNTGEKAARDLEIRNKTKWLRMHPGYDYDVLEEDLCKAAELVGIEPPSKEWFENERALTDEAVAKTKELLGDTAVAIDYTAVDYPLELTEFMLERGFNVESVFLDAITESEERFERLKVKKPELKVYGTIGWNIRQMDRSHEGKIVCVGQKSAYFMNSDNFVNVIENAGMCGFSGIRHLMELIREAYSEEKPMREIVSIKGWGCSCV